MIGLVIVSHSRALADAAVGLASEMVPAEAAPQIAVAAGLDETTFGTDATAIAAAIEQVDSPDGVLIMVDLGSAILSAEMALEFVDPDLAGRCHISAAPLVEGLIAAVVTAGTGASLAEVTQEAEAGLVGKRSQLGVAETAAVPAPDAGAVPAEAAPADARTFTATIRNPHGLHARPAAALVSGLRGLDARIDLRNATTGAGPVPATSLTLIQTLGLRRGDQLSATVAGPQADQAVAALTALAADDFGEAVTADPTATTRATTAPAATAPGAATVTAPDPARTGQQIAIGPAVHTSLSVDTSAYLPGDPATEQSRLDAAIAAVHRRLDQVNAAAPNDIYQVQAMMLDDAETLTALRGAIAQGQSAPQAVAGHFAAVAAQLAAIADPYFQARAEDQRGLARWLAQALVGVDSQADQAKGIFIVEELDPVTAGTLDPALCDGVITTHGGATGHGVIIAQARGFAILTGRPEAAGIPAGQVIAFDPTTGQLWPDPSPAELDGLRRLSQARIESARQAAALAHTPALTPAGQRVLVEANIGSLADAQVGQQMGAEGSGLVRTEVLFGDWTDPPTAEEQADLYIQIGRLLDGTITVRTWDPGGDKPLAFLAQEAEANPMLGERGLRAMRRLPGLLDTQLEAILLASRQVPIRVMFPMVTLPDEVVWARQRLSEVQKRLGGQVSVGMMVETPAAALMAADFTGLVDFVSIGSNDLTQYTMAVDRGNALVADLARRDIDAVWRLIGLTGQAFAGKPVAVCGDLASKPELAGRLIGAGVTELSVRPPLVGLVKQAVRAG